MLEKRYFDNNAEILSRVEDPKACLVQSVSLILHGCPPSMPWAGKVRGQTYRGFFIGPTSIAYLFYRLSQQHPDLTVDGKSPAEWCTAYLNLGQDSVELHSTESCGITSEYLSYNTLMACTTQDERYVKRLVEALSNLQMEPNVCEWMKGRSGALYLLRMISKCAPRYTAEIQPIQSALISHILAHQPWGYKIIGAAHGDIGIITQVVLSDPDMAPKLESELASILDYQQEEGNWPISEDKDAGLIQFCHGAPGVVISLIKIRPYFPSLHARIDVAIDRARKLIWERGLLAKEPNLCHGITGNALALDDAHRDHFLSLATPELIRKGVRSGAFQLDVDPFSILWGEAGRALVWLDVLDSGDHGFPIYTDV